MKTNAFQIPRRLLFAAALLLSVVALVPCSVLATPGLIPASYENEAYLDFSSYPASGPTVVGLESWVADGWDRGSGALRLTHDGAYLETAIYVPPGTSAAQLTLTHRSALAPGCPSGGSAPVTISVSGSVIASGFAAPAEGGNGFSTARWEISDRLTVGRNRVRITAGDLCSVYEIRSLRVAFTSRAGSSIVASQMTHGIEGSRPTDNVTAFAPGDARAVCWTEVASEAIGRRIEFRFFDPSGELYYQTSRTADRYNWGYIWIAGRNAADRNGSWRVEVTVDGALQLIRSFTIGSVGTGLRPTITGIDFPSRISANGQNVSGAISFYDPDGDITWVTFEAVEGFFSDFEFDPDVAGRTAGEFTFNVYARLRQHVRLKVILYDRCRNESEPYWFSFNAE